MPLILAVIFFLSTERMRVYRSEASESSDGQTFRSSFRNCNACELSSSCQLFVEPPQGWSPCRFCLCLLMGQPHGGWTLWSPVVCLSICLQTASDPDRKKHPRDTQMVFTFVSFVFLQFLAYSIGCQHLQINPQFLSSQHV